jgi:hypothetical protein
VEPAFCVGIRVLAVEGIFAAYGYRNIGDGLAGRCVDDFARNAATGAEGEVNICGACGDVFADYSRVAACARPKLIIDRDVSNVEGIDLPTAFRVCGGSG